MDGFWHLRLLGTLRAERDGQTVTRFRSQKFGILLAFLAIHRRRTHAREELVELLWPDEDLEVGRTNLRAALASLRRQLEPEGVPPGSVIVSHGRASISLGSETVTTDVEAFEAALKSAWRPSMPPDERHRLLAEAVEHYAGPLLPGCYETWALAERDRLAEEYLRALRALIAHHEGAGDMDVALGYARRALSADPLREEAHADVIRLLQRQGQAVAARRQYEALERLLDDELGMKPSAETRALLTHTASPRPARTAAAASEPSAGGGALVVALGPAETRAAATPAAAGPPATARLPVALTRFFGRDDEMAALSRALLEQGTRLVTLTGPGGTGKTRLAVETARRLEEHFLGGLWFVPLADIREPSRVAEAVAEAMSLPRSPSLTPLEQVVSALGNAEGRTLLVLDNMEHLVEGGGADLTRALLLRSPDLCCLVTSRQRLLIEGEQEISLRPLPVPASATEGDAERGVSTGDGHEGVPALHRLPSVQLFVDRARASRPDFGLNERNAAIVAELCRRLDGIPLAIELAAAWASLLTPTQMLERLDRRFDLLVARRRDAPSRHATLRATTEWSWDLLPPALQRFFAELSIFRGGWTLDAAEAVTGETRTLDLLAELRERSLIIAVEQPDDGGEQSASAGSGSDGGAAMRFRMLETLREFASERAEEIERTTDLAARHHACFLGLAEVAAPHLRGPEQLRWLARLGREHQNLRAALAWSLGERQSPAAGLRMASALTWFWLMRGHMREGIAWLEMALEPEIEAPPEARARALRDAGWLAWRVHEREQAEAFSQAGLLLAREQDDLWSAAFCLNTLGLSAHHRGDPVRAQSLMEEAVASARSIGDGWLLGHCLGKLGQVLLPRGETARARTAMEEALVALRAHGDRHGAAEALRGLGNLLGAEGRYEEGIRHIQESIVLFRELGDTATVGRSTLVLSFMACDNGDPAAAYNHADTALRLCRDVGDRYGMAHALHNRANARLAQGMFAEARGDFAESLRLFAALGYHGDVALSLEGFARLAVAEAKWERVVQLLGASAALRTAVGVPPSSIHNARLDQDLLEARRALGEDRVARVWDEGRSLSVEQAITIALEENAATT